MTPFYEFDVDQRGRTIPESEKRLNPGDKVTLARKPGEKGEKDRHLAWVEIETDNKAEVVVFDRETPVSEEHPDGPIRTYRVKKEGVRLENYTGADLEPNKVVKWREDSELYKYFCSPWEYKKDPPLTLEKWKENHPISSPIFGLFERLDRWQNREKSRLLWYGKFIGTLPIQLGLLAVASIPFTVESINLRLRGGKR